jgi:hypothetical protein
MGPEERQMTAEEWVARFAEELGVEPPGAAEFTQILELAAEAAHSSERTAAPIACWIAGRSGKQLTELVEVAVGTRQG